MTRLNFYYSEQQAQAVTSLAYREEKFVGVKRVKLGGKELKYTLALPFGVAPSEFIKDLIFVGEGSEVDIIK